MNWTGMYTYLRFPTCYHRLYLKKFNSLGMHFVSFAQKLMCKRLKMGSEIAFLRKV